MGQQSPRLSASGIVDEHPNLSAYVARGDARPALKRAFAARLAAFTGKCECENPVFSTCLASELPNGACVELDK